MLRSKVGARSSEGDQGARVQVNGGGGEVRWCERGEDGEPKVT